MKRKKENSTREKNSQIMSQIEASESQKDRLGPENMKIELGKVEEKPDRARQSDSQIDR